LTQIKQPQRRSKRKKTALFPLAIHGCFACLAESVLQALSASWGTGVVARDIQRLAESAWCQKVEKIAKPQLCSGKNHLDGRNHAPSLEIRIVALSKKRNP
jgi:hypothetical protein